MNNNFKNAAVRFGLQPTRITDGLGVNGPVSIDHLRNAYGIDKPEILDMGMAKIFSASDMYHDKPMLGMTQSKGNVKILSSNRFKWKLSGDMNHKLRITRVVTTDPFPGINFSSFKIVLDKSWFSIPDVIQGENNAFWLRVMDEYPVALGVNEFEYTVQLQTSDPAAFFPPALIREGREFTRMSSAVADDANPNYGGFNFGSIFESEGQLGQFAREFELEDKACRKVKQCADEGKYGDEQYGKYLQQWRIPFMSQDEKGNPKKWLSFMSMGEAEMWNRLYQDVEMALVLGKKSSHMMSPNGKLITTGSGLREMLEAGNVMQHTGNLTLSQLADWFTAILKDKRDRNDCKVVLSCGIKFAEMFDRMIKADSAAYLTLDTVFIRKGEDYKHMDYGSYFASYKGFIVDITVMINPAYDNKYFQPKMHPMYPNYTIDSWRADILDFGSAEQQGSKTTDKNICMVKESYMDYHITHNGKWDGKTGMPITTGAQGFTNAVTGYKVMAELSGGLMIADVSRCGSIYLNIED